MIRTYRTGQSLELDLTKDQCYLFTNLGPEYPGRVYWRVVANDMIPKLEYFLEGAKVAYDCMFGTFNPKASVDCQLQSISLEQYLCARAIFVLDPVVYSSVIRY